MTEQELPEDFGEIGGQDHPDSVVARVNWNKAVESCRKIVDEWRDVPTLSQRAGEMTAQEKRTVLAVLISISGAIRSLAIKEGE